MSQFIAQSALMASSGLSDALSSINSLASLLGINKFRTKWMAAIYCSAIVGFYLFIVLSEFFHAYQDEEAEISLENEFLVLYNVAYVHLSFYCQLFIVIRAQFKGDKEDEIFCHLEEVSKSFNCFSTLESYLRCLTRKTMALIVAWMCSAVICENILWYNAVHMERITIAHALLVILLIITSQTKLALIARGTGFVFKLQNTALLKMLPDEILTEEIDKQRLIFGQLCDLMRETNEYFGPVLVASLPIGFLSILWGFYFICIGIWNLEPLYADRPNLLIFVYSAWSIGMITHHWNIFHSCEKTASEVNI